jgi:hypothetical protein
MLPLYAARIEDLGLGDFVKVDRAACHQVALLTLAALLRVGRRALFPAARARRGLANTGVRRPAHCQTSRPRLFGPFSIHPFSIGTSPGRTRM